MQHWPATTMFKLMQMQMQSTKCQAHKKNLEHALIKHAFRLIEFIQERLAKCLPSNKGRLFFPIGQLVQVNLWRIQWVFFRLLASCDRLAPPGLQY